MTATSPVLGQPSAAAQADFPLRAAGTSAAAAWQADGGCTAAWELRVASVTGARHRLAALGGEDAYAWTAAGAVLVVAVADGVGSTSGASHASAVAVTAACHHAAASLMGDRGEDAASSAIVEAFAAANTDLQGGPGATTLVVVVLGPSGSLTAGRIGDSTVIMLSGERSDELFAPEVDDSEVPVSTRALPAPSASLTAGIEWAQTNLSAGMAAAVITDGVADPWRDGPMTVAPSLEALVRERPSPLQLAAWADFSRRGCHDDRTIVVLWPVEHGAQGGDGSHRRAHEGGALP